MVLTGVMSGATTAGLLQGSVGWHSTTPCMVLAIGDKRGYTARLCVMKVRPHHAAPTPSALAESSMADRLQAGRSGLQMSSRPGTIIPCVSCWMMKFVSLSFEGVCIAFRLMNCLFPIPNSQPMASSRHCTDLEQSSAAYHICPSLPVFCSRLKT